MSNVTHDIVAKLWNLCNVLKDDDENGGEELPEPALVARETMTELEGAFEELRGILGELGEEIEEVGVTGLPAGCASAPDRV